MITVAGGRVTGCGAPSQAAASGGVGEPKPERRSKHASMAEMVPEIGVGSAACVVLPVTRGSPVVVEVLFRNGERLELTSLPRLGDRLPSALPAAWVAVFRGGVEDLLVGDALSGDRLAVDRPDDAFDPRTGAIFSLFIKVLI